jgi:hypothetical protein
MIPSDVEGQGFLEIGINKNQKEFFTATVCSTANPDGNSSHNVKYARPQGEFLIHRDSRNSQYMATR